MIQKTTFCFIKIFFLFGIILFTKSNTYAQSIIPDVLGFDRICAGGVSNPTYKASFQYSGYQANTTFEVELSDKTGSFSTPTATTTISVVPDAVDRNTITFSVPADIVGSDTYSLRIKASGSQPSSGNFSSSTGKKQFPIYFKIHDQQYTINNFNGTATFCSGGSYVLSIDPDSTDPINNSPLKYPSLSYNWYRDNGTTTLPTLVQGAGGPTYTVTSPGTYYVETNYGTCTSLSYSNRVIVSTSATGSAVTINSSLGNPFCSNGEGTVLTATSGNSYVWKKDGKLIEGATARTFSTNQTGFYTVDVDFGGCVASGDIDLKSTEFTSSINVPETNVISQGETLTATVTTDASNPSFQWFLNNGSINGATSNSYNVTTRGNYKVVISQSAGCLVEKEFLFSVSYDSDPATSVTKIANIISLSSYPYDVWDIPSEYKNPQTNVKIISSNGDMVLDVFNYQGDWPPAGSIDIKNVNPVYYYVIQSDTGEKKGSITLIK